MYRQMPRGMIPDAARECVRRRKDILVMQNILGPGAHGFRVVMRLHGALFIDSEKEVNEQRFVCLEEGR